MRFDFISVPSLPRLAWCAHLRRGRDIVDLYHGPWVETGADWFVEGAWTGPFADARFIEADHMVGTGGRAEERQVVFAAPSNLCDRVYSQLKGDDLYLSNSLPFVLELAGDAPDPNYLDYAADRRHQQMLGILTVDKRLPMASGRPVLLHDYCNISVTPDLSIRRSEKPTTLEPLSYADYLGQLEGTIARVHANAGDPARRHQRYRPIAMVSRGYDCNGLAALMIRHGAKEAIAFRGDPGDDGTAVGERMGYTVTQYPKMAFLNLPGAPEAEFQATPWGSDVVMAPCEPQLVGGLLVSGRRGDTVLKTQEAALPKLASRGYNALSGSMMGEFRIRVGFMHFVPYYVGASHTEALQRISSSAEMKPWSVGGASDRPVPRRFIEEAGVPRDWFGQHKFATAHFQVRRIDALSPGGAADFSAFLRTVPPIPLGQRLMHGSRQALFRAALFLNRQRHNTRRAMGLKVRQASFSVAEQVSSQSRNVSPEMSRLFHWGVARVRSRYAIHS